MRLRIAALVLSALAILYLLPFAFQEHAVRVCESQVSGEGSFSVGVSWFPLTHWTCKTKAAGRATTQDIGWYPDAKPRDK